MEIEQWPTEKLVEYARNPRKNDHAVDRVASLLKEYGFRSPIIALSDGEVVDGHLRLKAARKLGLEHCKKPPSKATAAPLTKYQQRGWHDSQDRQKKAGHRPGAGGSPCCVDTLE